MTRVTHVLRIPVDESLNIDQCLINGTRDIAYRHLEGVTNCIRATISRCFPIMIKLYMNSMHAACGVGRGATNTVHVVKTWSVNAESGIRCVHPIGVS